MHIAVCSREANFAGASPFLALPSLRLMVQFRLWTLIGTDGPVRVPILTLSAAEDSGFGVLEAQMELVCVGTTGRNRSGTLAGSLCHTPVRQAGRVCRRGQLRPGFAEGQHSAETRARQTDPISGGRRKTAWKDASTPGLSALWDDLGMGAAWLPS